MAVSFPWLFLMVTWVGMWSLNLAFPSHTHLLFICPRIFKERPASECSGEPATGSPKHSLVANVVLQSSLQKDFIARNLNPVFICIVVVFCFSLRLFNTMNATIFLINMIFRLDSFHS